MEGTNEKGKLGGGFCPQTLAGGKPQSNAVGAREGELSPSGFFDDQADLAWCFALRVPPLMFNGEDEVAGVKVTGSGGRDVIDVPFMELRKSPLCFWGVLKSTLVPAVAEAPALRSGLSRTLNKTFFNL